MKISITLITFFLAVANISAQYDTTLVVEDIMISTNRIKETEKETARNLAVFTKAEIQNSTVSSLPELLQFVAGIDLKRRGINSVQSDISMRGGTFNQVLVMVNNIKMIDPQTGHHMMNIPINVEDIERIEVTKGPAARLYGQNAFSGVVNIITKLRKEEHVDLNAQVSYASYNTVDASTSLRIPNKSIDQLLSFSYGQSDGYRHNTDYKLYTGYYTSDIKAGNQKIHVQAGYTGRKFGANGFYASEKFTEQYEEVRTAFASVASPIVGSNFVITPRLSWRNNRDNYFFIRNKPTKFDNVHTGNVYNAEVHGSIANGWGTTGIGVDLSYQTLTSNNLGDRTRTVFGVSLEHKLSTLDDKLDITGGAFLSLISNNKMRIYPGIDVAYHISDNSQLFASYNYANRLPTYTNLYYSSPSIQGTADLLPEDITSYEFGYKYWQKPVQFVGSIYHNRNSNLIDWAKKSETDEKWQTLNIANLNHLGLDMSIALDLDYIIGMPRPCNIRLNYNYIDAKSTLDKSYIGRYTLGNLNHQFASILHSEIFDNFSLDAAYRYYDRETLEDYQLLEAGLSYAWKSTQEYKIKFTVNNIMDIAYREINLVPMPGRWYSVSVSMR